MDSYYHMEDSELMRLVRENDDQTAISEMCRRYKKFIRLKCKRFYLEGYDQDDVLNEGTYGFCKALRDFDVEKSANFHSFAELCITRQIITAIKTASRKKHKPLNNYKSLSGGICGEPSHSEGKNRAVVEFMDSGTPDPLEGIALRAELQPVYETIVASLSPTEKRVYAHYIDGLTYREIAAITGKTDKSIDNCLQRIKKKLMQVDLICQPLP